jgi:malonate decarboxylase beta subunit
MGAPALVAFMDGHIRGGTLGVRESRILAGLLEKAISFPSSEQRPAAVILGFDTGGVRVEEGPIALAAASGVAVLLARLTLWGVPVAALISGPRGCFGAPAPMAPEVLRAFQALPVSSRVKKRRRSWPS